MLTARWIHDFFIIVEIKNSYYHFPKFPHAPLTHSLFHIHPYLLATTSVVYSLFLEGFPF